MNVEDIQEWLRWKQTALESRHQATIRDLSLTVSANKVTAWAWGAADPHRNTLKHADGGTPDQAISALLLEFPSANQRAANLRDQAREMLRRAMDIENGGAR